MKFYSIPYNVIKMKLPLASGKFRIARNLLSAIGLLFLVIILFISPFVVSLSLGLYPLYKVDGKERLAYFYGGLVNPKNVVKYKFEGAFGNTSDYWKLKNVDVNSFKLIINDLNFQFIQDNNPCSLMGSPNWWPKSADPYLIYEKNTKTGVMKYCGYLSKVLTFIYLNLHSDL
jgi:hypothetical protein